MAGGRRQAADGSLRRLVVAVVSMVTTAAMAQTVGPLLESVRGQDAPYNLLCPYWKYDDGRVSEERCVSGCVATAIEQVLAYHRYPEALQDTLHGWETPNYVIDDMLPGTRFDWGNYLLDYRRGWTQEQGMAIAVPTLACGMAAHMNYGLSSSGANTERAVEPLQRAFGYDYVRMLNSVQYTPSQWLRILRHELEQGYPVVYTAYNMAMSGHAFNLDGIRDDGFVHVNWCYDGAYDGWYDPEWLNPWEVYDRDPEGIAEGLFCNHYMMLMHPYDTADTLAIRPIPMDSLGIVCEKAELVGAPATRGYIPVDFTFLNTGQDTIRYTYEVMTWLPADTAIFEQADYVGVSGLTIPSGERRTQRAYLRFTETGDRLLGISHDDETIPFTMPVTVTKAPKSQLEWGSVWVEQVGADLTATLGLEVTNKTATGVACDLVTYCLWADGEEDEDVRHWKVLSLSAGDSEQLKVSFSHLRPDTHYHFAVRCPWTIVATADFVTPIPTGIGEVQEFKEFKSSRVQGEGAYDLLGRPVRHDTPTGGTIYIQNGRKWLRR